MAPPKLQTPVHIHIVHDPPRGGPLLVLLNMALMNLHSWEPLMAFLPAQYGYLRHDYRGTGDSIFDQAHSSLPDLAVLSDDVVNLLDQAGLATAILVGASFGSRVALATALRHPERVRGLCLFDANIGMPPSTLEQETGLSRARAARLAAGLPEQRIVPKWFRHRDRDLARQVFYTAKDISQIAPAKLSTISVPTLLATGVFDSNLAGTNLIAGHIPGARQVMIEAASHGTITQRPDIAAAILAAFVEDLAGPYGTAELGVGIG